MQGEAMAADYLTKEGYEIIERNWRSGRIELDIIAKSGETLIFVEVKNRSNKKYELPEHAVNQAKQNRIAKAAADYLEKSEFKGEIRFDIIAISGVGVDSDMYHIRDAFFPMITF